MSSQLPIRVEENLQSCIVIVFEPFVRSECDIHDLVQLLVSLSQIQWHVFRIIQGLQAAGRVSISSFQHNLPGVDQLLLGLVIEGRNRKIVPNDRTGKPASLQ